MEKKLFMATTLVVTAMVVVLVFYTQASAENMFGTSQQCEGALLTGAGDEYQPKFFGLNGRDPVDGKTKIAVPLETAACVRMKTTAGVQWVIQKKGTVLRWNVNADGSLGQPYAREDCGNPINGISYPQMAARAPQQQVVVGKGVSSTPTPPSPVALAQEQPAVEEQHYVPPQYREVRAGVNAGFLGFFGLEASTNDMPRVCAFGCPPPVYVGGGYPVSGVTYTGGGYVNNVGYAYIGSHGYIGGGHRSGGHHYQPRRGGGYHPQPPPRGGGGRPPGVRTH